MLKKCCLKELCFILKWSDESRGTGTPFLQSLKVKNLFLKGICQEWFAHAKCFFIYHMAMFWLLCFREGTPLTEKRREARYVMDFLVCTSRYPTALNSISSRKTLVNIDHTSPMRKTKNCTMKAKWVCLLSEFLGMAMYHKGQRAIGEIPGFAMTLSDWIKNLQPR